MAFATLFSFLATAFDGVPHGSGVASGSDGEKRHTPARLGGLLEAMTVVICQAIEQTGLL